MTIIDILKEEYLFYTGYTSVSHTIIRAIACLIRSYHFRLVVILRVKNFIPLPAFWIKHYIQKTFSVEIGEHAILGKNLRFYHLPGIVIGDGAVIGDNCKLFQGVLIGQSKGKFPVIGNNVTLCANSCIIGNVKIGDNVIILANSVVTKDIPDNSIAAGVPAVVIKEKGNIEVS